MHLRQLGCSILGCRAWCVSLMSLPMDNPARPSPLPSGNHFTEPLWLRWLV
jgi:hypothetical protein